MYVLLFLYMNCTIVYKNCTKLYIYVLKNENFTSGAMYCSVPVKVSVLGHIPANRLLVPKSDILTTPL